MSKTTAILVALLCVALAMTGCGRNEKTYTSPDGKVTVTDKGGNSGKVEIETKDGKATVETQTRKSISEAELGVPVYPGVEVTNSSKMEANGEKVEHYYLATPDSVDKVEAFYKSNLKNIVGSYSGSAGDSQSATFTVGSEDNPTTVTIVRGKDDDKTSIMVIRKVK